jgi:hypothetical protein
MNPNQMQTENQMPPEDLRAALGFSNRILSQTIPPDAQTTPQEGEFGAEMPLDGTENPETTNTQPMEETPPETPEIDNIKGEFEDFKKQTKKMIKEEVSGLKEMIKEALNNEEDVKEE